MRIPTPAMPCLTRSTTLTLAAALLVGTTIPAFAAPLIRTESATYAIASTGGGFNVVFDAAVAGDGSSVLVGQFEGELVLGSGAGTVTLDATGPTGFVARFDATDQIVWAQSFSGGATAVAIDGSGVIGVAGSFSGTASFGGTDLTAGGDADAFLARYQPNGTLDWVVQAGGTTAGFTPFGCQQPRDIGYSVAFGPLGTISMSGGVTGTSVTFSGTGGSSQTITAAADDMNGFVARYSSTGALEQVVLLASAEDSLVTTIRSAPDGRTAITGFVRGTGTVGGESITAAGGTDAFVALIDPSGDADWVATIGGTAAARPVSPVCGPGQFTDADWPTDYGAGLDVSGGAIVVLAEAVGTTTVQNRSGTDQVLTGDAAADRDIIVARYALDGTLAWATRSTSANDMLGGAVVATPDGGAVSTGYFRSAASFGTTSLAGVGETTMFVAGYGADGATLWADAVDGSMDGYSVGFGLALTGSGDVIAVGKGADVDLTVAVGIDDAGSEASVISVAAVPTQHHPVTPVGIMVAPERAFRVLYSVAASDPDPTPLLPAGPAPTVGTGAGELVLPDGTIVPLAVSSPAPGQVRYTTTGVSITLTGAAGTSSANGLIADPSGEVLCEVCMDLTVRGVIEVVLWSTPRLLAAHRIDDMACQLFAIPMGAPLDGGGPVTAGTHVLQLLLPTATGLHAANFGVTVGGPVPTGVPSGVPVSDRTAAVDPVVWLLLLVGAVGAAGAVGAGAVRIARPPRA